MNRLCTWQLRSLLLVAVLLVAPVTGSSGCALYEELETGGERPGAPDALADAARPDAASPDVDQPDTPTPTDAFDAGDSADMYDADTALDTTPDTQGDDTIGPQPPRHKRAGIEIAPGAGLMMSPNLKLSGSLIQPLGRDVSRSANFRLKTNTATLSAPDTP